MEKKQQTNRFQEQMDKFGKYQAMNEIELSLAVGNERTKVLTGS